ncbi:MAG TPA: hypothetical protein VNC61_13595 [Acidimicrobiales bacterium]|nr:hypothetical protein [Acidimicrobiales bacterium]
MDLVGSTALAERLAPDDFGRLISAFEREAMSDGGLTAMHQGLRGTVHDPSDALPNSKSSELQNLALIEDPGGIGALGIHEGARQVVAALRA